jgi:hypothetical protein
MHMNAPVDDDGRIRCDDQELIIHGYRLASAAAASTSGSPTIIGTLALLRQAR